MPRKSALLIALVLAALCQPMPAMATVLEEVLDVPVRITTTTGQEVAQTIKVTVFRDDQRDKSPYLVLNHGRTSSDVAQASMRRQRFPDNSRYFVSKGFVVLVPTRVGYGDSGGTDAEWAGGCDGRDNAPSLKVAARQTALVLQYARTLDYVDLSRGVVVGQSFGGMTAITLAGMDLPGLIGAANFSGGAGGNPERSPEHPCSPGNLLTLYRAYGAAAKIPTLWLYSDNDRFWGKQLPRDWFTAFTQAGGKGRFVQLPAHKENGHHIFSGAPQTWRPAFEDFLRELGF